MPDPPTGGVRLLVGPANFAGQGWAWSRAAQRHLPGVAARCLVARDGDGFGFPADQVVPAAVYRSAAWAHAQEPYVLDHFSHVLGEAGRPVLGLVHGTDCAAENRVLAQAGVQVALVAHGSDVRLPSRHAGQNPFSPFADLDRDQLDRLQERAERLGRVFAEHPGPTFVSTPDLLDDVPTARWLPVVVEMDRWAGPVEPLQRARPIVVHAPSDPRFKGTGLVEPVLSRLAERGLITYRRLGGVPHADLPRLFAEADIVLDQVALGIYSVVACEAMAAGRVVLAHVSDTVRDRVRRDAGEAVPILQADPDSLERVLEGVCAERDRAREQARAGVDFVRRVHDGALSARVLAPFLVSDPSASPQPADR